MPFSPDAGRVRLGHQPAFAGLRAVAITLVVALHLASSFVPSRSGLLPGGILGVDVFFVLSGFLITTLLFEQNDRFGRLHVVRFYRDRALRLLPTLVIALAGWDALALVTHVGSHRSLAEQNVAVLSYLGNWFQSYGHFLGIGIYQSWSLSVEEQFYLVWPAVILLVLRRGWSGRRTAVLLVVAIVVVVVWRAHLWLAHPSYLDVYYRTDARADALLVGALASVAWRAGWVRYVPPGCGG